MDREEFYVSEGELLLGRDHFQQDGAIVDVEGVVADGVELEADHDLESLKEVHQLVHHLEGGEQQDVCEDQALDYVFLVNMGSDPLQIFEIVNEQTYLIVVVAAQVFPDHLQSQAHTQGMEDKALCKRHVLHNMRSNSPGITDEILINFQFNRYQCLPVHHPHLFLLGHMYYVLGHGDQPPLPVLILYLSL